MRLLIVEPSPGGHHLVSYSRYLVREACGRGWEVGLLTSRDAVGHPALNLLREEFEDRLDVRIGPPLNSAQPAGLVGLIRRQFRFHRWVRRAARREMARTGYDIVILMSFDSLNRAMAALGSPVGNVPVAAVAVGVRYHWPEIGIAAPRRLDGLERRLFERAVGAAPLKVLFTIDASFVGYARRSGLALADKVAWIPDPGEVERVEERKAARRELGIEVDSLSVLIYGGITPRKGLERLICGALGANREGVSVVMIVAGECNDEARAILASTEARMLAALDRLVVRDGFQDAEAEGRVFGAADLVWVAYDADFLKPSAVMSQAAQVGLPCIAMAGGLIARAVTEHELGPVLVSSRSDELVMLMSRLVARPQDLKEWSANARNYGRTCTSRAFGKAICDRLEYVSLGARGELT